MMLSRHGFRRSEEVKEVIHIKVKKYAGYFNPECKRFAVDPHVTTFSDVQKILIGAFNLDGPFHISYLCRDDAGESVYLALLTDWDLDAAFLTSSDPYLRLKVDAEPFKEGLSNKTDTSFGDSEYFSSAEKSSSVMASPAFQVPRAWMLSVGNAINKITTGIGYNLIMEQSEKEDFFPCKSALGDAEYRKFLDFDGRLGRSDDLRLRIYHGGVEPSLRKVVWRQLLNVFPEHFTGEERIAYMKLKNKEYHSLYSQWRARSKDGYVQELSNMVWKDVLRTDRSHRYFGGSDDNSHLTALHNILLTYALTHPEIRYCQGMSDIAAPILMVMDNEAHGYVSFCGAMVRLGNNFSNTGEAMTKKFEHLALLVQHHDIDYFEYLKAMGADNMFFCYRWILLEMKREFKFEDALLVLEVMWSSLPPRPPDNHLSLGQIVIDVTTSSTKSLTSNRESLPNLSLNTKNLTTSSKSSASFPNIHIPLSESSSKFAKHSQIQQKTISYHCENLYTPPTNKRPTWSLGGISEMQYSALPSDDNFAVLESEGSTDPMQEELITEMIHKSPKSQTLRIKLPPPEEFGCGNPFLLFVCLAVLLDQRDELMSGKHEYDDLVMHFDRLVRKHHPNKILSKAMKLFAAYLKSQALSSNGRDGDERI